MDLQKFTRHFGFNVVRVKHHDPYQRIDMYNSYSRQYLTTPEISSTFELEIGRRELEHMADYFARMEEVNKEDHLEWELRRSNPALKEAYSKYKMLLALYK